MTNLPSVFITGPTASGKTALAIKIANKCNGEIISADSRAIYKGADIATAKPSKEELSLARHWGIDIVDPGSYFSVADYKKYADEKIADIRNRGKIPIIVGGTGLYIDSVLFDYKFGPKADWGLRSKLQHYTVSELQDYCCRNNIQLPDNSNNKRYLIRSIEKGPDNIGARSEILEGSIVVGISTEKAVLLDRIKQRADYIFSKELIEETKRIAKKCGWDNEVMKSNAYPIVKDYLDGCINFDQAKEKFIISDWHLAKKQLTWLRRNKFIHWGSSEELEEYIINQLEVIG